jgi:hypothetical protein
VHVIDASESELEERFRTIDHELAEYGAGLDERPQIVVLNKLDLLPEPPELALDDPRIVRVLATSTVTGAGIEELKNTLFELCPVESPVATEEEVLPEFLEYRPAERLRPRFRIFRTERGYRVMGKPQSPDELEDALRRTGIKPGTEVEVEGETLEWQ